MRRLLTVVLTAHCCLSAAGAKDFIELPPNSESRSLATEHWSFQPVREPGIPSVGGDQTANNTVDRFIQAELATRGLSLSPPANSATLIRRLYLVLHGLLPSREQMEYHLSRSGDWYVPTVDYLLASPRFGERWGRFWLDLVRYADSQGFETNRPRPYAYHYRDYVIRSFNTDRPFSEFVLGQIAGDAVGQDVATGFLVAGPNDIVRSPDIELTLMQRSNELADFVNVTSTAFMGLTVACARCHDHKFDPVFQTDYYAMEAVFAGVRHGDRDVKRFSSTATNQKLSALDKRINAIRKSLSDLGLRPPLNTRRNEELFEASPARFVRFTVLATNSSEPCLDEVEIYSKSANGVSINNVALATLGTKVRSSGNLEGFAVHQLAHIHDGKYGNGHSWISNEIGKGWVEFEFPKPITIDRIIWGRDREGKFADRLATRYQIDVALRPERWKTVATSSGRVPSNGDRPSELGSNLKSDIRVQELIRKFAELQNRRHDLKSDDRAYAGTFEQPQPTHRLFRGDPMAPREVVAPDQLFIFGSLGMAIGTAEQERRLRFAKALTSEQNPFVARVIVNRLWQYTFGQGLVITPNDLGVNGVSPSHPQLLDYLAFTLRKNGWSLKTLQRQLLLSATFRQDSASRVEARKIDANNRLLWRFAPRRIEAEAIRDSILQVAGNLDLSMGGPGFDVVEVEPGNVYNYRKKTDFDAAEFRRMVYARNIRGERDVTFGAFDCPDGGQVTPRRAHSTTALQALNLLNSPFIVKQSKFLAERLQSLVGLDETAQVRMAFELLFQRQPDEGELRESAKFVRKHGLAPFCRVLFNSNEFLFVS